MKVAPRDRDASGAHGADSSKGSDSTNSTREAGATGEANEGAEFIPFDEFRNGLPHGRFRLIVNPNLAPAFVAHATHATPLALALIGPGIAAALYGHVVLGGLLVAAGWLLRWTVKKRAPFILLHLVTRIPAVYEQAAEHGVLEVQRS